MWPFRQNGKPAAISDVLPSEWSPRYYATPPAIEVFNFDLPPVLSWPDMDADDCGHRAAESLMGLFSRNDPTCDLHLWCGPGDRMVIAECYQAHGLDDPRLYIGVYLWPVRGLVQDDTVLYGPMASGQKEAGFQATCTPKPLSKALIWPLACGDVVVQRGTTQVVADGASHWDQGIIDPGTSETIRCASREVSVFLPTPPEYQNSPPAFLAVRTGSEWGLGRCWQLGRLTSGATVWQSTPAMSRLDAMYQPHRNEVGQNLLTI